MTKITFAAALLGVTLVAPAQAETLLDLMSTRADEMLAAESAAPGLCDRMASEARRYARAVAAGAQWMSYRYEIIHDPMMRPDEVPMMTWLSGFVFDNTFTPDEAEQEARSMCETLVPAAYVERPVFDGEITLTPEMRNTIGAAPEDICVRLGEDARLAVLARQQGESWEAFRTNIFNENVPLRLAVTREVYGSSADVDEAQETIYTFCAEARAD